jgi:hypothetical protein
MHSDRKSGIRIIAERVSVTTIRTRSKAMYCEKCGRALSADEIHLTTVDSKQRDFVRAAAIDGATENKKGENE